MLKYLFVAQTRNHQMIRQTQEDSALLKPEASVFYDVLHNHIKQFALVGEGHVFSVDLDDGHFEIDGRVIYTQPPPPGAALRLIYYHQVQQRLGVQSEVRPDGVVDEVKHLAPITRYYIGWQTTHKGKNYKFELGVD